MALALRLGMPLARLRQDMSAEEMFLWRAYDRISPISDIRSDINSALTRAAVFQAQGAEISAADLIPKWGQAAEQADDDGDDPGLKAWFLGRAKRRKAQGE